MGLGVRARQSGLLNRAEERSNLNLVTVLGRLGMDGAERETGTRIGGGWIDDVHSDEGMPPLWQSVGKSNSLIVHFSFAPTSAHQIFPDGVINDILTGEPEVGVSAGSGVAGGPLGPMQFSMPPTPRSNMETR